ALVALDAEALATRGKHRVEQLRRTSDRNRLALGASVRGLRGFIFFAFDRFGLSLFRCGPLLERPERQRLGVGRCLFLGERIELAGLWRVGEGRGCVSSTCDAASDQRELLATA